MASTPGTHCYCQIDVGRTSSSDESCRNYLPSEEDFDLYMADCGNFCFSNIRVAWRPRFKALMKEPRFWVVKSQSVQVYDDEQSCIENGCLPFILGTHRACPVDVRSPSFSEENDGNCTL